jgi:hypothetical protein
VVSAGTVQVSTTLSPLRAARKSVGGLGNSSDGGRGGPIAAHPANTSGASATTSFLASLMRKKKA